MRKRSGALHSDSSQEFMLLAEYAHEKTGYFYDESLHKEVKHKLKSKIKRTSSENEVVSPNPNKFKGFDFATHDEEFLQQNQEVMAHSHTIQINIVLICQNTIKIRQKLEQVWPTHAPSTSNLEKRQLDLFVYTMSHVPHHTHCYKFWILDAQQSDNPIYSSYLNRAKKIIRIGQGYGWVSQNQIKGKLFESVSSLTD